MNFPKIKILKDLKESLRSMLLLATLDTTTYYTLLFYQCFCVLWFGVGPQELNFFAWIIFSIPVFLYLIVGWFTFGAWAMFKLLEEDGDLKEEFLEKYRKNKENYEKD